MKFILLIGHGSRDENGNNEIRQFAENLVKNKSLKNTEVCFLEFGTPDIANGIENCVNKGASEIIAIPVILLPAGHSKFHIPEAIDKAKEKYPQVKFYYGTPVGSESHVLEILSDRIDPVFKTGKKAPEETAVIITGRGSSDPDANSTLFRISRLFWEKHKFSFVETAFMGITRPLLPESLEKCQKLGAKNIIILPYFLFTGVLIERMKKISSDFAGKFDSIEIQMAEYFGFHHLLEDIIIKKIHEAENGISALNCDLCQFRQGNYGHGHHHHDHDHHGHDNHEHAHEQKQTF
jgi:sirohydrochlorin cobaltochelatase